MTDEAREAAWLTLRDGDTAPALVMLWPEDSRVLFEFGFDAGVAEGIRRARAVAAPDFTWGSEYRRENYVRQEIVEDIDALGVEE